MSKFLLGLIVVLVGYSLGMLFRFVSVEGAIPTKKEKVTWKVGDCLVYDKFKVQIIGISKEGYSIFGSREGFLVMNKVSIEAWKEVEDEYTKVDCKSIGLE